MKILISSYSCETGRGSEGEIGWRIVHALALKHDVTVITRKNLKEIHNKFFIKNSKPNRLTFEYFDLPWLFRFYKKGKRGFLIYYYFWQIGIAFKARLLNRKESYDILHHLVGGMDWMPSGLSLCKGIFIWGPVGSENTNPLIIRHQSLKSKFKDKARSLLRNILRRFDPFILYTSYRAKIIFSHTPENLPKRLASVVRPLSQTAIHDGPDLAIPKKDIRRSECLKLIFAGDLKSWKGAKISLIAALKAFELGISADLTIVGDGPLFNEMKKIAKDHPNGRQVRFLGRVSMKNLVNILHESDILLSPTYHHGLSTVVLQAMLTRLPIICISGDATGRAVGQEAGITVTLNNDEKPTEKISQAIVNLAENEKKRQTLANQARERALKFYNYESLAEEISEAYEELNKSY